MSTTTIEANDLIHVLIAQRNAATQDAAVAAAKVMELERRLAKALDDAKQQPVEAEHGRID